MRITRSIVAVMQLSGLLFTIFTIYAHASLHSTTEVQPKSYQQDEHSASYLVTRTVILTSVETGTSVLTVHKKLFEICSG